MDLPERVRAGWARRNPEALWVALAVLTFIAISVWWLLYDQRAPGGGDPGRHLSTTIFYSELLADLRLAELVDVEPLSDYFYPPLVYLVGAVPGAFGLALHDWGPIALNVVFVPLLAAGCYLVGRRVYGPRAGVLAAVFALGTPMVLQLFHVYLLDAPLVAMVAISVWTLLASERFTCRRESVLAGALVGLAMLIKPIAPVFVLGVVGVMLVGGGWRQWRNVGLAALAGFVVAAPFFLVHLDEFTSLAREATVASQDPFTQRIGWTFEGMERFSPRSFAWYGWAAVNTQYLVPLFALFLVGLVFAVREMRHRPHMLELLAGLGVGYLAMTFLSLHDPRYTLPLVVFVAVIATGWIATASSIGVRGAATGFLLGAVALNVAAVTVGGIGTTKVAVANADSTDLIRPGTFTFTDERGYVTGEPRPAALWDRLLSTAKKEGLETIGIAVREAPLFGVDTIGFDSMAHEYGLTGQWFADDRLSRPDLRVNVWYHTPDQYWIEVEELPRPCGTIEDGAMSPGSEGEILSVAVERRTPDDYERWCDF